MRKNKILCEIMLLGIFLPILGTGHLSSARTQENTPAPNVGLVQSPSTAIEPTFVDVPLGHPLYQYIQALYDGGYTAGCSTDPLMFCPDTILNRAQSAVFMMRGQFGAGYTPPAAPWPTFLADNWTGFEWAQPWAEGMYQAGLTTGCQTNPLKYCPATPLTRVQASVFGLKMKYGESYLPPPATYTLFADMTDRSFWGTAWAENAFQEQLLPPCDTQYGKPMFCPLDLVNRGWGAYMIVKAKGLLPNSKLYVTNTGGNGGISVIDTASNSIITTISTGAGSQGITSNSDRTIAYSADTNLDRVSVIDLENNSLATTISVGEDPVIPAINNADDRLYVTNHFSSTVSVIDTATNKVIDTIVNVDYPWGIAVSPDDSRVAVTLYLRDAVAIYDTSTLQLVAAIDVGSRPEGVIYVPDGSKLAVANNAGGTVSVVDTNREIVIQTIRVGSDDGDNPTLFAFNADATKIYVPNIDSNTVSEIDVASGIIVRTFNVGYGPLDVTVIPPYLYVTNSRGSTVSVVDLISGKEVVTIEGFSYPHSFTP